MGAWREALSWLMPSEWPELERRLIAECSRFLPSPASVKKIANAVKASRGMAPSVDRCRDEKHDPDTCMVCLTRQIHSPLFDFSQQGFPIMREALARELPQVTRKELHAMWEPRYKAFAHERIAQLFRPKWEDYTEEEQRDLCRAWNVRMPEASHAG